MRSPFKILLGLMSVLGLSAGLVLPSVAQSSPNPGSRMSPVPGGTSSPGQINPSPGTNPNPGILNEAPYRQQPSSVQPQSVVIPMTGSTMSLADITRQSPSFTVLNALIPVAGTGDGDLLASLQGEGKYTVFAPTDAAFAALPEGTIRMLVQPENRDLLIKVLSYHMIPGSVTSQQIGNTPLNSVEGNSLNLQPGSGAGLTVNNAQIIRPDIQASNGVIHAIDRVLLPPDVQADMQTRLGLSPASTPANPAL